MLLAFLAAQLEQVEGYTYDLKENKLICILNGLDYPSIYWANILKNNLFYLLSLTF